MTYHERLTRRIAELDSANAVDSAYRELLSTGSRTLGRFSSWRDKAIAYATPATHVHIFDAKGICTCGALYHSFGKQVWNNSMDKIPRFLEPQHVDGCIAVAVHAADGWFGNVFGGAGAKVMAPAFVRNIAPQAILPGDWPA